LLTGDGRWRIANIRTFFTSAAHVQGLVLPYLGRKLGRLTNVLSNEV